MLGFVLGVEVVERAKELIEAVRRGQMFIAVAEVVFPELAGLVTPRLEQLGDRHVAGLEAFLRTRQPHLEHAGAEADLPGDEGRAAGGAALLPIPVGEQGSFPGNAVNVRRLVAHHALVVGTDVPVTDVVAPDDEDVGLPRLRLSALSGGRPPRDGARPYEDGQDHHAAPSAWIPRHHTPPLHAELLRS